MIKHHVKATNMQLTEAISDYLSEKLKSLQKFIKSEMEGIARVEVGKTTNHHNKGDIFRAEINLEFGDKKFRAVVESDDLYKAIDQMKDDVVREVTRANKKRIHLLKRGHQRIKDVLKGIRDRF